MTALHLRPLVLAGAAFASIAGLAMASPASANLPATETPLQMRVAYGDLDLASATGRKMLEHRIDRAATGVCRPAFEGTKGLDFSACTNEAKTDAHRQIAAAAAANAAF